MMNSANILTGSSLLAFNPQGLCRTTFNPRVGSANQVVAQVELPVARSKPNRLVRNEALYFSEPEDVRKCIENLVPDQSFCLILTNSLN